MNTIFSWIQKKNKYVNTLFSDLKSRLRYKSTSVKVYYLHQLTPRLYMYDMFFFNKYWLKNLFLIQYMEYLLDQHSSRLDKMPQSLDKTYDNIKICFIWWLFCPTRPMIVFFFRQLSWKWIMWYYIVQYIRSIIFDEKRLYFNVFYTLLFCLVSQNSEHRLEKLSKRLEKMP